MSDDRYLSYGEERKYKFILVGDSNVGKTALFWRFTEGDFLDQKQTQVTTIDFKIKNITLDNKDLVKLYIWDTAGQEKYRSIVSTYFKGCQGVVIVFDVTRQNSYENAITQWYDIIKSKAPTACIILIGNKNDLQKRVNEQEVIKWCKSKQIQYLSTSVKTGKNVEQVFMSLAKKVKEKQVGPMQKSTSFELNRKEKKKKGCC